MSNTQIQRLLCQKTSENSAKVVLAVEHYKIYGLQDMSKNIGGAAFMETHFLLSGINILEKFREWGQTGNRKIFKYQENSLILVKKKEYWACCA